MKLRKKEIIIIFLIETIEGYFINSIGGKCYIITFGRKYEEKE